VNEAIAGINTCYPGRIITFDPVTQLAIVQVALEQYYKGLVKNSDEYTKVDRPLLHDVPVQFPFGGGFSITMPVKTGDDCLVLFAQRGMDHWLYDGSMEAGKLGTRPSPQHMRMHNYSDALCIVGFNPEPKAIQGFDADNIVIRNADNTTKITIAESSVVVDAATVTVNATTATLNANATVNGDLDVTGDISAGDIVASEVTVGTKTLSTRAAE